MTEMLDRFSRVGIVWQAMGSGYLQERPELVSNMLTTAKSLNVSVGSCCLSVALLFEKP